MNAITHVSAPEQQWVLHDGDTAITLTQTIDRDDVTLHIMIDEDLSKLTTELLVMPIELAVMQARALLLAVGELVA